MRPMTWTFLGLLFLGSVAVSLALVPSEEEVAWIRLRSGKVKMAQSLYEDLWSRGEVSVNVTMPLTQLHLQNLKMDQAIQMMELFVEAHPNNIGGRQKLGQYFSFAQKPGAYLKNLQIIAELQPSEIILRELASLYNFGADYGRRIATLQVIISKDFGKRSDSQELADLLAAQHRYAEALDLLDAMESREPLTMEPHFQELYANLAVETHEADRAVKHARGYLESVPGSSTAMTFVEILRHRGEPQAALSLLNSIERTSGYSPQYVEHLVQTQLVLSDSAAALKLMQSLYEAGRLPNNHLPDLLSRALRHKEMQLTQDILESVALNDLPQWSQVELFEAALSLKNENFLRVLLTTVDGTFVPEDKIPLFESLPLLGIQVYLAVGNPEHAQHWMQQALTSIDDLSADEHVVLAEYLLENGQLENAFETFDGVLETASNPEYARRASISILLQLGRPGEALDRARVLQNGNQDDRDLYRYCLQLAHRDGEPLTQELVDDYLARLGEAPDDPSLQEEVAYALIELRAVPLDLLRTLLARDSQKWMPVLEEHLQKAHRSEELKNMWVASAAQTNLSPTERRSIAFRILEAGWKNDALVVFLDLAKSQPPQGADVQQVLHLWGPRPDPTAVLWLAQRFRLASKTDKPAWLGHLANVDEYSTVRELVEENTWLLADSPKTARDYARALFKLGHSGLAGQALKNRVFIADSVHELRELASLALNLNQQSAALDAYSRLLERRPNEVKALKAAATAAYSLGELAQANKHFLRLSRVDPLDYNARFFLGEIQFSQGRFRAAKGHYREAMTLLDRTGKNTTADQLLELRMLGKLGEPQEALRRLSMLSTRYPDRMDLKTEYLNMLIDHGHLEEAESILAKAKRSP